MQVKKWKSMQKCLPYLMKRHKSATGNISDENFIILNQFLFYGIPRTGQ
jgi:hypothetical protein